MDRGGWWVDDGTDSSEISPGLLKRSTPSKVENLLMDIPFAHTGFQWKRRKANKKIL